MSDSNNNNNRDEAELLRGELFDFCSSASLSEEGLRDIIERHGVTTSNNIPDIGYGYFFFGVCRNERANEGIIQSLLEYFPGAARFSVNGCTPLHHACYNKNLTLGIIQLLIDAAPESVRSADKFYGNMPLHDLCDNRKYVDEGCCIDETTAIAIMKLLVEKCPESIRHANDEGYLPIHLALAAKKTSPEFCRELSKAYLESEDENGYNVLVGLLVDELLQFCRSDALSEDGLREIIKRFGLTPKNLNNSNYDYEFFLDACRNERIDEGIIRFLLEYFPDAAGYTNYGSTPLYVVCDNESVTLGIVQLLIDAAPEFLRSEHYDDTPLHRACTNKNMTPSIIQLLIDAAPDFVGSVSSSGEMPLHRLCNVMFPDCPLVDETTAMEILELLLKKCPESIRHTSDDGYLPLHWAACKRSPAFCRMLIEAYPGSERINADAGLLPLHLASADGNLGVVEYLHKLYPDAVNCATTFGQYPIHSAIRSPPAVDVVRFLIDCDPNVKLQKCEGRSLLHFACSQLNPRSNWEIAALQVIKALYDAHPEAIEYDRLAYATHRFHPEVQTFINEELVHARQAGDHRLITTPDENGQLPLHHAVQNNVTLGSIKLLLKGNPSAIRCIDSNGALPLHLACQHHNSPSAVQYLVDLDVRTLETLDRDGNTALHYACRGAKYETIALLLEKYDAVSVSKRNAQEKLPIDLLWESNAVEDRGSVEYLDSIFRLMKAYPETLKNFE